jgi:isopenicillin N synthase-like dioxygenase
MVQAPECHRGVSPRKKGYEPVMSAIPVIDLAAAEAGDSSQLDAVRGATEELGAVQVVNHGEDYLGLYAVPNVWPEGDPGLRTVAFGYLEASRGLAERMLRLYAKVQGLPAGSFGLGALPHLRLTVNDYPTWSYPEASADEDKLLLLEHADDSAVTAGAGG